MTTTASAARRLPRPGVATALAGSLTSPATLVGATAVIGLTWMAVLLMRRVDGLAVGAWDLAFFQQVVWNVGHGAGFTSNFSDGSFLGLHFSPLLALPAALELVWSDARLLSLVHAAALAATGPTAFLLLRAAYRPSRAGAWLAAGLSAPLPFWLVMQEAVRADFHTEALALPLALLAGWAGLTRRSVLFWCLAVAAILAKEDQAYTVAVIGALVAARAPGRLRAAPRVQGLLLGLLAVAWVPIVVGVVMPALRDGAALDTLERYAWLGQAGPGEIAQALLGQRAWLAALALVVSLGGLPLLAPRWALLALPPLVANLLSRHDPQQHLGLHYGLLLVVPLIVAAAFGGRRLLLLLRRRRPASLMLASGAAALALALIFGRLPPALGADPAPFDRAPALERLRAVAALVPADAPLAVDDNLAPVLAGRARISILPDAAAGSYLVVDRQALLPGHADHAGRSALVGELASSGRPLLVDDGRFQVWGPFDD